MANPENFNSSENRMMRGERLAREKTILENADGSFSVPSATVEEIAYLVRLIDGKYVCNCLDFKYKEMRAIETCKHVHAVKFWVAAQVELKQAPKPKVFADDSIQCQKCGSNRVWKYGFDAGKQIFKCKDCKAKFRYSLLKKAKYSPDTVSLCLDLYFSGTSLAKTARIINNQFDVKMTKVTVYRWIQKFIPKISEYVNSLSPQLSGTWHADELFVKMKAGVNHKTKDGRKYEKIAFLWNVMDRKTRFLLASKLSPLRDGDGATRAFKVARENAHGQEPETIFTDSLRSYIQGRDYAWIDSENEPKLVRNAGVSKPHATNNRIERMNGTLRERVKVQRGWKSYESKIAEGQRIHYNFVKPHQSLEGQTPAQRAGISGRQTTWLELLAQTFTRGETA